MSRIKRILLTIAASLGLLLPVLSPGIVRATEEADIEGSLCAGAQLDVNATEGCDATGDGTTVNNLIATVINIISIVVGVVAVIMLIIGGLKYITSNGDSGNVTGAKNTILYAIIGLVVVALAQIVVRFILGRTSEAVQAGSL